MLFVPLPTLRPSHLQDPEKNSITTSTSDTRTTSAFKRTEGKVQHRILAMLVKLKPNFAWCWCELDLLCPSPSPTPAQRWMLSWGPASRPNGESPGAAGPIPASCADYKDTSSSATAPLSTAVRETNSKTPPRVWLIFLLPTSFGENQKESLGAVNLYLTNPYRNRHISEGAGAAATSGVSTFNLLQLCLAGLTDPEHKPGTR